MMSTTRPYWLLILAIFLLSVFSCAYTPKISPLKKFETQPTSNYKQAQKNQKKIYYRNQAVVLIYHDVNRPECGTSISPQCFTSHMNMLAENGFSVVSLEDVAAFVEQGKPLPANAVAITLDDACISNYQVVMPILQAKNWPMAIFVTVSEIGKTRPNNARRLNWQELKDMERAGILVGSHTYAGHKKWGDKQGRKAYWLTQRRINESNQQYRARVLKDLIFSRQKLEQGLSTPVLHFAHPFGAYNDTTVQLAQKAGYKYIWTTHPLPVRYDSSLLSLGRVSVGIKGTSAEQLKSIILKVANSSE